ncbi:hypothetical protein V6N13_103350 [Hibiscus sabdariffa]
MEEDCTDNNPGFEEHGFRATSSYQSRSVTSPGKTTYASMVKKGSIGPGSEPFDDDFSPDKVIMRDDDCIVSESVYGHSREEYGVEKGLSTVGNRPVEEQMVRGQQEPGSKELYGPWMIATNRRRRPFTGFGSGRVAAETPGVVSGSRFAVLQEDSPLNVMEAGTEGANPTHVDPNVKDVESVGTSKGTKKVISRESNAKRHARPVGVSVGSDDEVAVVSLAPRSEMTVAPHKVAGSDGVHRAISIREGVIWGRVVFIQNFLLVMTVGVRFPRMVGRKVDINAIRSSSDQDNAMEEDGRESDSPRASRPSHSRTEAGVLDAWSRIFPLSRVLHLERGGSDHCPIVLEVNSESSEKQLGFGTRRCMVILVLGKKRLVARIRGIKRALQSNFCDYLVNLDKQLKEELDWVLEQEELLWFQKARSKWVMFGDRNMRFFHAFTLARRKANTILKLKLEDGEWCSCTATLQHAAMSYFSTLFTSSGVVAGSYGLRVQIGYKDYCE